MGLKQKSAERGLPIRTFILDFSMHLGILFSLLQSGTVRSGKDQGVSHPAAMPALGPSQEDPKVGFAMPELIQSILRPGFSSGGGCM